VRPLGPFALGRLVGHLEKDAAGATVFERYDFVYNSRGQVLKERGQQKQVSGSNTDTLHTHTINYTPSSGALNDSVAAALRRR
jgi:hypothetical protein